MSKEELLIRDLLDDLDIKIDGDQPWDIRVKNKNLYKHALRNGSMGLGESYMDGWWDVEELDEFFFKLLRADLSKKFYWNPVVLRNALGHLFFNLALNKAYDVGEKHYDIGNDLYKRMLDPHLAYTCGYWQDAENLEEAQTAKLDLVCRKLGLKPGQHILDIGSGWGSFIKFAAQNYGVSAVGVTISKEQTEYANANSEGLPIETRLQEYQDVDEKFDHIVSIGMFEHVGHKNYRSFMKKTSSLLKDDGLFLLHTIGSNKSTISADPWLGKYIFPYGILPSIKQIAKASEGCFVVEDWHNFGSDYDKTLMGWYKNFDRAWPELKGDYDERFYRMWKYYLLSCAGSFRARKNQLWQIVLSKKGVLGGYESIR